MNASTCFNPYAGNILIDHLGPILDRPAAARAMTFLPPRPENPGQVPKHIRLRYVIQLRDYHWVSLEGLRVQESIDMALRDSYRYRDPNTPQTWSVISGEKVAHKTPRAITNVPRRIGSNFGFTPCNVILLDNSFLANQQLTLSLPMAGSTAMGRKHVFAEQKAAV